MTTIFIANGIMAADRCCTTGSAQYDVDKMQEFDGWCWSGSGTAAIMLAMIDAIREGKPFPKEHDGLVDQNGDSTVLGTSDGINVTIHLITKKAGSKKMSIQSVTDDYPAGMGSGSGWKIAQGAYIMSEDFFRALDAASYCDSGTGTTWDVYDFTTKTRSTYHASII